MTSRNSSARSVVALTAMYLGMAAGAGGASAQAAATQSDIPVLEPSYTRVFGTDSLQFADFWELSLDGRWIAFVSGDGLLGQPYNLWALSADGGDPILLASGESLRTPYWFPSGDRIAYSAVPEGNPMIMTLPFDPETGRGAGPPQRVTLEPAGRWPMVSPDGQWIQYWWWELRGTELGMSIGVVPSTGGPSQTVATLDGKPYAYAWSRDGRHIYLRWQDPAEPGPSKVMRVSLEGGSPERVTETPTGGLIPTRPYLVKKIPERDAGGGPLGEITTMDGRVVARVGLPNNVSDLPNGVRFAADGRTLLVTVSNTVEPLRTLALSGGTARQLGDSRASDIPIGWSPDGRVVFQTQLDGRAAILAAPVDGGAAVEYAVITQQDRANYKRPIVLSEDGRYIAYTTPSANGGARTLLITRVSDGQTREVTRALFKFELWGLAGPGGSISMGSEFLYMEDRGETAELRAASFDGPSRLLRANLRKARGPVGVHGDRVIWSAPVDDSTGLFVAVGPEGTPRPVTALEGLYEDLAWSPDGQWVAASVYTVGGLRIQFIGIDSDGTVNVPPRLVDAGIATGSGIRWLPDSRAITLFAQTLPSLDPNVLLIPLREDERPVNLTRDETAQLWYYSLSPDGRHISYPAMIPRGGSLWLAELGDALPEPRK